MNDVRVRCADLIARITRNRDEHHELFLKAQQGFRDRVIEELDAMLAAAKKGDTIRTAVRLVAPEDHTKDYDHVLDMLSMAVAPEIDITFDDFKAYVRNEWAWMHRASTLNTMYASGGKVDLP